VAVHSYFLDHERRLATGLDPERMAEAITKGPSAGTLWVDFDNPTAEEIDLLDEVFALHPLTIEDCTNISKFPKVEDFGRYLFMVLLAPNPATLLNDDLASVELDICMGANWVMTYHTGGELGCVTRAVGALRRNSANVLGKGPAFLFHRLVDGLVDDYFPLLDVLDRETEEVETHFLNSHPSRESFSKMLALKRNVLHLRRIVLPHREMIGRVLHEDYPLLGESVLVYFRDVADHLARIADQIELFRETIYEAAQMYNSALMQRTNEIMRVFTVVAALMMVPTVIASIWGMNFSDQYIPFYHHPWGFYLVVSGMGVMTAALIWFFRRKKWV
jgi:magnesium transporter